MSAEGNLDLSAIPLIDGHCHSIQEDYQSSSTADFLGIFSEAVDRQGILQHVPHTLTYRRAMRELAVFLGCAPNADAILEARRGRVAYLPALYQDLELLDQECAYLGMHHRRSCRDRARDRGHPQPHRSGRAGAGQPGAVRGLLRDARRDRAERVARRAPDRDGLGHDGS